MVLWQNTSSYICSNSVLVVHGILKIIQNYVNHKFPNHLFRQTMITIIYGELQSHLYFNYSLLCCRIREVVKIDCYIRMVCPFFLFSTFKQRVNTSESAIVLTSGNQSNKDFHQLTYVKITNALQQVKFYKDNHFQLCINFQKIKSKIGQLFSKTA